MRATASARSTSSAASASVSPAGVSTLPVGVRVISTWPDSCSSRPICCETAEAVTWPARRPPPARRRTARRRAGSAASAGRVSTSPTLNPGCTEVQLTMARRPHDCGVGPTVGTTRAHDGVMIAAAMGWIGTVGTIGAYVMLSRGCCERHVDPLRRPEPARRPPRGHGQHGVRRLAERRRPTSSGRVSRSSRSWPPSGSPRPPDPGGRAAPGADVVQPAVEPMPSPRRCRPSGPAPRWSSRCS